MGLFSSSEEKIDEKMVDSNGHVNNNIIIQEAEDTHLQAALSEKLLFCTYILVLLEIVKLTICLYTTWKRHMKKKYNRNTRPTPSAPIV